MILSGEFAPGAVISQLGLAKKFGVSTTPVREAMRQLQAEGLIDAVPNRRPRVVGVDVDDLHSLYAHRILMESMAVILTTASIRSEEIARLRECLDRMRELASRDEYRAWEQLHGEFHRALIAGASTAIAAKLETMFERSHRFRRMTALRDQGLGWALAEREHDRILAAMARREAGLAAAELARHLARTALGLSAALGPGVDPAPIRVAVAMVAAGAAAQPLSTDRLAAAVTPIGWVRLKR